MGAIHFSIDLSLVQHLRELLGIDIFVETGTFEGETVSAVRGLFKKTYSVELSEDYYHKAKRKFEADSYVEIIQGHSPLVLRNLGAQLKDSAVIYWLDAHWCVADLTAGETSQCPLLEELDAIAALNERSVILIDDARLFLCPPPYPHEVRDWPDWNTLVRRLQVLSSLHEITVVNDVIVCFPAAIRDPVRDFAYRHSVDWLRLADKARDYHKLLAQLQEKEEEIRKMGEGIKEKEEEIREKEEEIQALSHEASKRLELIQTLESEVRTRDSEIMSLRKSDEYRLGYTLLHPWVALREISKERKD